MSVTVNSYVTITTLAEVKGLTTRPAVIQLLELDGIFNWTPGSTETPDDILAIECASGAEGRYLRMASPYSIGLSLPVANGGTGATSLTDNGVVYGNGTDPVGVTAEGATGTLLGGQTGSPPVFQTGQVAAEAASLGFVVVDIAELKGLTSRPPGVLIRAGNGKGNWAWVSGDQSANVGADPLEGIWAAPSSAPSGASGAWWRQWSGPVNVLWYRTGADLRLALQAALDANPLADILIPPGSYTCSGPVYLSDITGRNFRGNLIADNATITFTNAGNATDSEIDAQKGFVARTRQLSAGGDTQGLRRVEIRGATIVGPAHGTSVYLANSQDVVLNQINTQNNRYGVVTECCISTKYLNCTFVEYTNAGVGLLMLNDTANVWYGSVTPSASYWNDIPSFYSCGFATTASGIAAILDHGSTAENNRTLIGGYMYVEVIGENPYGVLSRAGIWSIDGVFTENIKYPVRILSTNAAEGTGNIAGVVSAEPAGTYAISNFVDGYSQSFIARNCFFSRAAIALILDGVANGATLDQNLFGNTTTYQIQSLYASNCTIVDLGNAVVGGGATYLNVANAKYLNVPDVWSYLRFGAVVTAGVNVSALPSPAGLGPGARHFVLDSTATLAAGLGNVVAGGGANRVPIYSDGVDWIIG